MSTDTAKKQEAAGEGGGVADYFAILGVGENLVWKHAQKKSNLHDEATSSPRALSPKNDDEDEAALLERFYREVVEVTILSVTPEEQPRPRIIGQAPSYTEEHDTSIRSVKSSSSLQQPQQHRVASPALPNSPSHSDATTNVTFTEQPAVQTQQIELDGYTVVQRTCPAGRCYSQTDAASLGGVMSNDSLMSNSTQAEIWTKNETFVANLDPIHGLQQELSSRIPSVMDTDGRSTPLKGLQRKLGTSLRKLNYMVDDRLGKHSSHEDAGRKSRFQLGFRRRGPDETEKPAVADIVVRYVRIHCKTICSNEEQEETLSSSTTQSTSQSNRAAALKRSLTTGANIAARVAEAGKHRILEKYAEKQGRVQDAASFETTRTHGADAVIVPLEDLVSLPVGFDEWAVPQEYRLLKFSHSTSPASTPEQVQGGQHKTILINHTLTRGSDRDGSETSSGMGVEAYMESVSVHSPSDGQRKSVEPWESGFQSPVGVDPDVYLPKLLPERLSDDVRNDEDYIHIPILAVRRQRAGDEERYHEDPGVVDVSVTFCDSGGHAVLPDDDDEEEDEGGFSVTGKSKWTRSSFSPVVNNERSRPAPALPLGTPLVLVKRNLPIGFADAAFATKVLDRFPLKNYKDLPLPEEELPMFCYPTGCRLYRARYSDAPLPQYYGFVVKNERGDSIHVSCVSFMEPLTSTKVEQLNKISEKRSRVSLAHRHYSEKRHLTLPKVGGPGSTVSDLPSYDGASQTKKTHGIESPPSESSWHDDDSFLVGFGDMTTYENKTICLISRYPFWTAFRRFLSHLHVLSGSLSDLPLERCISHLLLSVPVPKPGGPCIIVPLPALNGPMVLSMPPAKDFPLVDLPFQRLLACLDVPTIITIVLGFLALERKIIIMSTRPSLVLDACELLRSLLFPFELCAPYVPRLTQPFMSCLDFPGAIFVGIHDDGTPDGLASLVRNNLPEDSAIVDLDTGEIDCSGDRYEVLKQCWGVIPSGPRTVLVSEIETLCRDAGIVPGQEPLDSQVDSAFNASLPAGLVDDFGGTGHEATREPLDDRAVRDAFLRFFCSVLGGYERHLVVPDVDFLISGNEWFDAQGFLAGAPQERAPYLGSLVTTQLFQSFIQRRTETGDVHCLLFDECLAEFHSSPVPYGRLGGDVETVASSDGRGPPQMLYSLLVDQCSTVPYHPSWDEDDGKGLDVSTVHHGTSTSISSVQLSESMVQEGGDIVTQPSRRDLVDGKRFVYCVDGNSCFPQHLDASLFYPSEPEALLTEMSTMPSTLLARTEREVEEANRRRKLATTYRGLHTQRRCLWQLPKLMGAHFLGAWLICIPSQVSQPNLSFDQQSRYLLRALGAFRLLRNKQRIVADEAAYRALIAACGRTGNDRRLELVKLFGLLRSDGIFPSAVTLGQYTRALAEGYSKRSFGMPDDHHSGVEVTVSASNDARIEVGGKEEIDAEGLLNSFDGNLALLEDSGRRWRQRYTPTRQSTSQRKLSAAKDDRSIGTVSPGADLRSTPDPSHRPEKRSSQRPWLPVATSSSFVPFVQRALNKDGKLDKDTRLIAMWSRTSACESCSYVPLDEEIQSGWDVVGSDVPHTVSCPRCGSLILPMLGYKEMSLNEALEPSVSNVSHETDDGLPRQIVSHGPVDDSTGSSGYVTYLDPSALRTSLERYVHEEGESALDRDSLRKRDPELFINLFFYCARFSLPLPLPIPSEGAIHYCAFVAWDRSIAFHGCNSGARALASLYGLQTRPDGLSSVTEDLDTLARKQSLGEYPLLARFNLQEICQSDWDQKDLSEILVTLVEACDKRDFRPVLECVFRCNKRRLATAREALNDMPVELGLTESASFRDATSVELDCYRTLLYLAKYQCTSVFHVFFPATAKPCKGYHFWCAIGTPLPVFDHLFREAVKRLQSKGNIITPLHDVADVALGFRCVFGHII